MLRRRLGARIAVALTVASCGAAFTSAPDDAGDGMAGKDGTTESGAMDAAVEDAHVRHDATASDAVSEEVRKSDGSPEPADGGPDVHDGGPIGVDGGPIGVDGGPIGVDGGPIGSDGGICLQACPGGFECLAGKCVDRAAPHFSATTNKPPGNWSYGYTVNLGATFNLDTYPWRAGASIDVWTHTMASTLEPSVFHNSSATLTEIYGGMTVKPGVLGLVPGATTEVSVIRWTAPTAGNYTIDATFTGISAPTIVITGVFIKGADQSGYSQALNKYLDGNTFVFPTTSQALAFGDNVDFYVRTTNMDDEAGGTELVATISAN